MTVQWNPNLHFPNQSSAVAPKLPSTQEQQTPSFAEKILESVNKVNDQQNQANLSILDLMTGKQQPKSPKPI